jgi:pSer/pThr/pTyr-binding forkhead associated (FHA) protein
MAKFIITRAGQPPREVAIAHERVTIGRHPYNDIVLAHSAVSGEHAVVSLLGGAAVLDDLRSTNGTFVNGQRIERQLLADGDQVAVAKFTLQFVATPPPAPAPTPAAPRVGSPGVLVVVIAREGDGFVLRHVDGASIPLLNGQPLAGGTSPLADGDMLELTGTRMVFRLTT